MTLALFPLGAIALFQTQAVVGSSVALSRSSLLASTERAAAVERELLERARGAAEALTAPAANMISDPDGCSAMMRAFIDDHDAFVFAGFIAANGMMRCSSNGATVDFSETPSFARALEQDGQLFEVNPVGAATGRSVVIVSNPVREDDVLQGFVSISFPHDLTNGPSYPRQTDAGVDYVTVNRVGTILSTSSGDLDDAALMLPDGEDPAQFVNQTGRTFVSESNGGQERLFAVSAMIPGSVAVVGSRPVDTTFLLGIPRPAWLPLSAPVLMWIVGIAVAFFGLHRLVVRHIQDLRVAMRRFALGDRGRPPLDLTDPPTELEALETSFNRMIKILTAAEAKNEVDLHEKTLLLREVHHRVKNNLQLIASIMNMHARTAQSPEARQLLSELQRRVRGLAAVHQTLNTTARITSVDSEALFSQLVSELGPTMAVGGQDVEVTVDVLSIGLGQDQASTLSMLAAEALTNAVKYVGAPDGGKPAIHITFGTADNTNVRFVISNTKGRKAPDETLTSGSSGIGRRLMKAFVDQLDGAEKQVETDDTYTYEVIFPIEPVELEPPQSLVSAQT